MNPKSGAEWFWRPSAACTRSSSKQTAATSCCAHARCSGGDSGRSVFLMIDHLLRLSQGQSAAWKSGGPRELAVPRRVALRITPSAISFRREARCRLCARNEAHLGTPPRATTRNTVSERAESVRRCRNNLSRSRGAARESALHVHETLVQCSGSPEKQPQATSSRRRELRRTAAVILN